MRAPRAAKRALDAGAIRRLARWPRGRAGAAGGAGGELGDAAPAGAGTPAGGLVVPGSIPPPVPGSGSTPPRVPSAGPSPALALTAILDEVERVRPGTVRRRALDLGCGSGAFTAALGAEFGECDGVDASETSVRAARLTGGAGPNCRFHVMPGDGSIPFGDEVFDFVRCAPLPADGRAAWTISEAIRMLRLLGVAVIDCVGAPSEPDGVNSTVWNGIHLSAPAGLDLAAGAEAQLELTLSNRGRSMWPGSVLDELRLAWSWQSAGQALLAVPETILQGSLVPGDSMIVRVTLHAPPAPGSYPGRLALMLIEPGGTVRALPALPVTVTAHVSAPPARVAGPSIAEAIEAAGGVILATTKLDSEFAESAGVRYFVGKS